jgi:photosystem II stability/assembly factor-like uncharacterized protein
MGVESIAVDPADPRRVYLACGTYTNANTPNGAILRSDDQGRTSQRTDVPFKFGGNEDGRGNGERLAVDPLNGRVLYLGTRHDGLWRSSDRGETWQRVTTFPDVTEAPIQPPAPVPGETPQQRWQRMPVRGSGIIFVKFAPALGNGKATNGPLETRRINTIYVGVSLKGVPSLFVSHDSGQTWLPVPNQPIQLRPTRAALSSNGTLYVSYGDNPGPSRMHDGAVWKLDTSTGEWTDITPDKPSAQRPFGYAAVAVDAHNPRTVIASTYYHYDFGGEQIFRSTDEGATWKPVLSNAQYDYSAAPYVKPTSIHWLFDIEIDPLNPDHATFTTGYGGWETNDLTAADRNQPTHWRDFATGIEETVGLELSSPALASPASAPPLISAVGDYGGFTHSDLDRPAPDGSSAPPRFGNTTGVQSAALKPEVIVRVGDNAEHKPDASIAWSQDGGKTWSGTPAPPAPNSRSGSIAVSADGATWIWTPQGKKPFVTHDRGATWTEVSGLPTNQRIVADPVTSAMFYAESPSEGTLLRSTDNGATFAAVGKNIQSITSHAGRGDNRGGQDRLYATPGRSGDLWFAAWDGLYRTQLSPSATGSLTPNRVSPEVQEIHAFGFGEAAPGKSYPAMYLVGTVSNQPGIFRSIDEGKTWQRINDDQHQWGLVLQITGDPKQFGRVYVGTHGRGIFYGDPATQASGNRHQASGKR